MKKTIGKVFRILVAIVAVIEIIGNVGSLGGPQNNNGTIILIAFWGAILALILWWERRSRA